MRIVFFVADHYSGSSRLRVLPYVSRLRANGHSVAVCRTIPSRNWRPPIRIGRPLRRLGYVAAAAALIVQRFCQIVCFVGGSDVVLIQKSLGYRIPWAGLEKLLIAYARRCRVRVVHDVDDAILSGTSSGRFPHTARNAAHTARASDLVLAGSPRLAEAFRTLGARTVYLPTCVPPCRRTPRVPPEDGPLRLCWTGVPDNLIHLRPLLPMLASLGATVPLSLTIVTRLSQVLPDRFAGLEIDYVPWSPTAEQQVLAASHIGLAPLNADDWTVAKCGARLLAYMAAGLPSVASPVGLQATLAEGGDAALLATDAVHWQDAITRLASDHRLYQRLAANSRIVADRFDPAKWYPAWRSLVLNRNENDTISDLGAVS